MPNQLNNAGLEVKTITELIADLTTALQTIYGSDINVSQNSPDGQLINIFAQACADNLALLEQVYNSFSVPNAVGIYLDQRVALNGLARQEGTYTIITATTTFTQSVTLVGLDGAITPPAGCYTVQDAAGNQFYLISSFTGGAGAHDLQYRAKDLGVVETPTSTNLTQVTVVTGVSVVETLTQDSIGTDEETDAQLRIRQTRSFWLGSQGPADAIEAACLAIPGVTDAFVAENDTAISANGVAAHGIWAIVENGTDDEVANAIYMKKAPGCAMTGSVNVTVNRPNGSTMVIKFDRPITQNLDVRLSLIPRAPNISFDNTAIETALAAALVYKLNQSPNVGDIVVAMLTIAPQAICTNLGVSKDSGANYLDIVSPNDYQHKFVTDSSRIHIV